MSRTFMPVLAIVLIGFGAGCKSDSPPAVNTENADSSEATRMNREMREMNMPADEAWTATVDSLRGDLIAMPDMSARELRDFIRLHHRRASKLIEMHRRMMQSMGM